MAYQDIRWSGSPDAVTTALAGLGHPAFAAEGAVPDPRIAAFGPYAMETVAGRAVMFALLRVPEGTEIEAPEGVFAEPGRVSEAVTGVFMEGVPAVVTNYQARAILMGMPGSAEGRTLFDDIDDALRAAGGTAWQAWEYANEIKRDSALVQQVAAQFGLTSEQLDDLFRQAAEIEA